MKKLLAALLSLLLLPAFGLAEEKAYWKELPQEGIRVYLERLSEWTYVTTENLEENLALVTACGDTEENARYRFAQGNILFEAYHSGLPGGRYRLEVFEDEFTRRIWDLDALGRKEYAALETELEEELFAGHLQLFNLKSAAAWQKRRSISGSLIAYPPYPYESGMFRLWFLNGKCYIVSYTQPTQASAKKHLSSDNTYNRVQDWTAVGMEDGLQLLDGAARLKPAVDLTADERLILNAHSGSFSITGTSEKRAALQAQAGASSAEAKADANGKYTCSITLQTGVNDVVITARKSGQEENWLTRQIMVDDTLAALELTKYPYGSTIRTENQVKGKVSPGAQAFIQLDEGEPVAVSVDAQGNFSYTIEADDWTEHIFAITAREDGQEDCTARFSFRFVYEDAKKGMNAYKKTLTQGLTGQKLSAAPDAYTGQRLRLEVYTTQVQRQDGLLVLTGRIDGKTDRPVLLICDSYLEDQILDKMQLTVYGQVLEPSRTEEPIPRVSVEYIYYLQKVYRRWPYGGY